MDSILYYIKKIIPRKIFKRAQPMYHYLLAFLGALIYRFPSRHINVIAITGTKGKSSTTEILNAILEAAGKKTAVAGTIRFKVGDKTWANKYKMTMPGRFFVQKFLRQAVDAQCEYAILEMTSGAVMQFRHKFINFNSLIFLNISPEHIEQHGSFENYLAAKLKLARALEKSSKRPRIIVSNADDKHGARFLGIDVEEKYEFRLKHAEPYMSDRFGLYFIYRGRNIRTHLQGTFNVYNILAALTYASTQGISPEVAQKGLQKLAMIPGRVQKIVLHKDNPLASKQDFTVVVDYAHTVDSLEKVYGVFKDSKKICVIGNTGGGRDTWKRPEMAKIADKYCSHIILTNEDPYDEDPQKILNEMLPGITVNRHEIIMDRRHAINRAIRLAKRDDTVLITGKGTDPYIMGPRNTKIPWSDAKVAEEELEKVLAAKK
ncbi:UDP-N-acetylmuramyl-tripeptide synthetase [Candidatus Parcubacteria bacterium]|nr:UDP-N-acetylmuramyl-tripeptide synthetase [Candidatus Parcubacteria bacterium]